MFAIVKTGGKQYRVEPGLRLRVEKLEAEPGSLVELPVLLHEDACQVRGVGAQVLAVLRAFLVSLLYRRGVPVSYTHLTLPTNREV